MKTNIKPILNQYSKTISCYEKFELEFNKLQTTFTQHCDFVFSINHFPAEGFTILHEDLNLNITLSTAISLIKDNGKLTEADFDIYGQ